MINFTINDICADYILSVAKLNNFSITRLEMQKLLYYAQVRHFLKNNKFLLIQGEMKAFQYGPIFLDQLNRFNTDSNELKISPEERIFKTSEVRKKLDKNQKDSLLFVMNNMLKKDIFHVVNDTHEELPWRRTWIEEKKRYKTIDSNYIIEFCEEIIYENKNHLINGN